MKTKDDAIVTAGKIMKERFPDARVGFCAGSYLRNEATPYSDIDLVVVFDSLPAAWRESFIFEGWPVEAFVHDPNTLNYFFWEVDAPSGVPSLPQMVLEGVPLPENETLAFSLKAVAKRVLDQGPASLSDDAIRNSIYGITDLVDDLRAPRNRREATAAGVRLYEQLSDFYLRSQKLWSASGKSIPRRLKAVNPELAAHFSAAFEELFSTGKTVSVIKLVEDVVEPFGGLVFDGYRRVAPSDWKKRIAP